MRAVFPRSWVFAHMLRTIGGARLASVPLGGLEFGAAIGTLEDTFRFARLFLLFDPIAPRRDDECVSTIIVGQR